MERAARHAGAGGRASALLIVGMAEPLVFQVRNHPNQIVYFSPLMGGPKNAFARYDMDYWGNSVLQAVQWADSVARASGIPLIVSGNPDPGRRCGCRTLPIVDGGGPRESRPITSISG